MSRYRHPSATLGVVQEPHNFRLQPLRRRVLLLDDDRGAYVPEHLSIACLLITARAGKRHEDRRYADVCELGDRSRPGSANDQVGGGVHVR
jgi:hypothetical protein